MGEAFGGKVNEGGDGSERNDAFCGSEIRGVEVTVTLDGEALRVAFFGRGVSFLLI